MAAPDRTRVAQVWQIPERQLAIELPVLVRQMITDESLPDVLDLIARTLSGLDVALTPMKW